MKCVITGSAGRMGQALIRTLSETDGIELFGALERKGSDAIGRDAGELAGLGKNDVVISDDAVALFAKADVVLDFTIPAATVEFAALAAQARVAHIIGTTGFEDAQLLALERASKHTAIVKSGNMSLGVNLLAVLVEKGAAALGADQWDIEVLEMHHRHKIDAPSGTAFLLGEAAAKGRKIALADHAVKVRDGITGPREAGTIGFATLRGGSVIGEHNVMFAAEGETVELSHKATDRQIFARGAVHAALWSRGKKPGLYSMRDVLGLSE